jgi:hypothetical protein
MARGMQGQGARRDAAAAEAAVVDIVGARRTILMAKVMRLTCGDHAWAKETDRSATAAGHLPFVRVPPARPSAEEASDGH